MSQRFFGLLEDFLLPIDELLAEILPLALVHERLFVGRSIELGFILYRAAVFLRRHCNPVRKSEPPARGASLYRAARWRTIREFAMRPNFRVSRQGRCAAALPGPYATRTVLAGPFDRPNRIGPGARRGAPRRKADAQLREFLELGQARARGQAEHMAAACPVGGQEVETPARHIDGAGRRRE